MVCLLRTKLGDNPRLWYPEKDVWGEETILDALCSQHFYFILFHEVGMGHFVTIFVSCFQRSSPHGKNLSPVKSYCFSLQHLQFKWLKEKESNEYHCKPHLQKHFSFLLKTCSLAKQHDSQQAIYHLKFVKDWNSELCFLNQWQYNESSFFLPHLFRRRSLKHGWDPLFVDFILVSPRSHWQLSLLIEEWQYVLRGLAETLTLSAALGDGDVMRRYPVLPFFKVRVVFHVEECEGRTKHVGGLCILH